MTQDTALTILRTGVNVFLTGEPGAGKTHTVNTYVRYLRERGVEPAITASTGIAATHLNGMTIHSWSGIGIARQFDRYLIDKISSNERVSKRVEKAKVLIIDEVSMLGPETLSMVDAVLRAVKRNPDPFGGIQVVLVGDFFQLPPIVNLETTSPQGQLLTSKTARFAYDSPAWQKMNPLVCYLTEQHRQEDLSFLELLQAIRRNALAKNHTQLLAERKIAETDAPGKFPKLYTHNLDVDRINTEQLNIIPGRARTFIMAEHGPAPLVAGLKKGCLSPEQLILKVGAAVMFTKNNPNQGFVNGTLGHVSGFTDPGGAPIIKTKSGDWIEVESAEWSVSDNGRVLAKISQLPLRLAWAITVHKSQGLSLDEAVMDLSKVFEYGQGYVAISRVRALSGVYLLGWNERAWLVHPEVLEKDQEFLDSSQAAGEAFAKLSLAEIKTMSDNFIAFCGGVARTGGGTKKKHKKGLS